MPVVYLITDPDGTRRVAPKTEKTLNFLQKHNALQGEDKRYKWEEYPNDEAAEEFIHKNGSRDNQHSPIPKVAMLSSLVKDQQSEIEQLKALLAASESKKNNPVPQISGPGEEDTDKTTLSVVDTLEKLKTLKTEKQINALIEGETRKTILDAAEKSLLKIKIQ